MAQIANKALADRQFDKFRDTANGETAVAVINDETYDKLIDEADANTTYVGEATIGTELSEAKWRIYRVKTSGTVTSIRYPGSYAFDQVWNDRASLTYPTL